MQWNDSFLNVERYSNRFFSLSPNFVRWIENYLSKPRKQTGFTGSGVRKCLKLSVHWSLHWFHVYHVKVVLDDTFFKSRTPYAYGQVQSIKSVAYAAGLHHLKSPRLRWQPLRFRFGKILQSKSISVLCRGLAWQAWARLRKIKTFFRGKVEQNIWVIKQQNGHSCFIIRIYSLHLEPNNMRTQNHSKSNICTNQIKLIQTLGMFFF